MKTVRLLLLALAWLGVSFTVPGDADANPSVSFTVAPAATGNQLVRTSVPLPRGFLNTNQDLVVRAAHRAEPVGLRVLSWYPATNAEPRTARRALVTFPHTFVDLKPVAFTLETRKAERGKPAAFPVTLLAAGESLQLVWTDGHTLTTSPIPQ